MISNSLTTYSLRSVSAGILSFFYLSSVLNADHGISTWGQLKYPAGFTHFDYTNPDAPKEGDVILGAMGTFDSLNMYIVKGMPAAGLNEVHATLLAASYDEVNTSYGYVAKDVEISKDGLRVTFTLNEKAQFNNGEKITSEDVIFSFNALRNEGLPIFKTYYADVVKVEKVGDHHVVFILKNNKNRELPVILGQLPVFSKKFYEKVKFSETSLTPPPASGPYEIMTLDAGHSITLKRVKNWWGENLPSQKGQHNFETMKYLYFRDTNALFEAFKAGQIHWRFENSAKLWHTGYDFAAVKDGRVKMEKIEHAMCTGTYGLFFNTRRGIFKNQNVRKALIMLYNFEWVNKNIFYNSYQRNLSYFPNSDFVAKGEATSFEKEVFEKLGVDLKKHPELAEAYTLPVYSDELKGREFTQKALDLLKKEGWTVKGQKLVDGKGKALSFEIMIYDKSHEKIITQYVETLKKLGIDAKIRFVDTAAYQERVDNCDFDMILGGLGQSNSPGNEQRDYFTSISMNQKGTRNYWGIHDPMIDKLVEEIITSKDYETLTLNMRVLDRLLLNGDYMIPAWHDNKINIASWNVLQRPTVAPKYAPMIFDTWWWKAHQNKKVESDKKIAEQEGLASAHTSSHPATTLPTDQSSDATSWFARLKQWILGILGMAK